MFAIQLVPVRLALVIGLLTLLFGFLLGAFFGGAEDAMKELLHNKGKVVLESVYQGDVAKLESVQSKSWTYFKRSHMHANGIGVVTLFLAFLFAALPIKGFVQTVPPTIFALGGLGYSIFWILAGLAAPELGATDLAKASYGWLAIPSTALMLIGLLSAILVSINQLFIQKKAS
jgi:hypothetical protein